MFDLFNTTLDAQEKYLLKDISNKRNREYFSMAMSKIRLSAANPLIDFDDYIEELENAQHELSTETFWWWNADKFKYQDKAYEIALDLANSIQTRFVTGGYNDTCHKYLINRKVV